MRKAKACAACRERRRRCEIRASGSPCTFCIARSLRCTAARLTGNATDVVNGLSPSSDRTTSGSVTLPKDGIQSSHSPTQSLCAELVKLYFDYVHDQFHSLFHQPSFEKDMAQGKAPKILLYGMMALSARFSNNTALRDTDPRLRGKTYANDCADLLDWNQVSLTTIQACVLLGAIAVTEGNSASENIYYAVACRIAQLLDLPNCKTESRVEQEINIRTWWSLCMIDVWSSTGVRLPRLLPPRENVPLPIDEVVFLGMRRDRGFDETIQTNRKSSLLAEMVRLNYILQQINDFNIRVAESQLNSLAIQSDLEDLSSQLDRWLDELPDHIRDTRENLERFSALGLGRVFVAIYLGYYHFGQMLFYRFLHEDTLLTSLRSRHYANKCKEHAGRLCDIVYASETVPNCDAKYNMVGHVLVIASTVQIHSLLFESNDTNVALAKKRLEKNFCILTQLCALWPTLDVCMDRLMAFHKACRESADTSFCMDQWMVRFLVEFASPVTDKASHLGDGGHWSLAELGITSDLKDIL